MTFLTDARAASADSYHGQICAIVGLLEPGMSGRLIYQLALETCADEIVVQLVAVEREVWLRNHPGASVQDAAIQKQPVLDVLRGLSESQRKELAARIHACGWAE